MGRIGQNITSIRGRRIRNAAPRTGHYPYVRWKEISAEEMEGKSGHLVMRYTYKNTSEEENGTYVPF